MCIRADRTGTGTSIGQLMESNWLSRVSPRWVVAVTVGVYVVMVPVLWNSEGTYGIFALLPVASVGLLYGRNRGFQVGLAFVAMNVGFDYIGHESPVMLASTGGVIGNSGMIALGWLVGYLRDLSESRLRQVVEEKDRLIGTISHELRTPLSTVVGLSHELADKADAFTTDEVAEFCGLIAQQSAELEALIEDLLVAARADIERIKVLHVPVDLTSCVASAVSVATEAWTSPHVTVRHEGGARPACGDSLRVRQIVRNLLQNAHRYGGDDIEVLISCKGDLCVITVSDDGAGVDVEQCASIFEPHVRVHATSGSTESLGLGLYVSRTLAGLMNGTLEYRRDADRTCFDLTLPAAETEAVALSA